MSAALCTDTRRLKRRWKRTVRHWARPHPTGGGCWALVTIAALMSSITTAYLFLWPRLGQERSVDILRSYALHTVHGDPTHSLVSLNKTKSGAQASDSLPNPVVEERRPPARDVRRHDENVDQGGVDFQSQQDVGSESVENPRSSPKACLAMIMKNEGPILPRLFESVKGFVSEYCIVDTGSTDDTIDVLGAIDMPGLLVEEPFVDFATTRNFLLDTCRHRTSCDYLVLLDADMVLRVSPEWDWTKLDGRDVYNLIQVSSVEYENVRIIKRTTEKIKVVGATHEYYDVPGEYSKGLLPKRLVYIDDVGDGKAKGDKFERDERLLRRELERDPDNVRTVFYLANTLKDQGKYREAIPYYERRVAMGGWFAEADYSVYMLSSCFLEIGDIDNARKYAEEAAFARTARRAEPLYYLAFYFHRYAKYEMAWHYAALASTIPKPDVAQALFIANDIYDYWVAYEQASLCRHVFPQESVFCAENMQRFSENPHAPAHLKRNIESELMALKEQR